MIYSSFLSTDSIHQASSASSVADDDEVTPDGNEDDDVDTHDSGVVLQAGAHFGEVVGV